MYQDSLGLQECIVSDSLKKPRSSQKLGPEKQCHYLAVAMGRTKVRLAIKGSPWVRFLRTTAGETRLIYRWAPSVGVTVKEGQVLPNTRTQEESEQTKRGQDLRTGREKKKKKNRMN